MVIVSTTSPGEARDVTVLLRQTAPGLDYRVFLMGRQVAARIGGRDYIADGGFVRLPDFAPHHPANCPPDCAEHQ